MSLPKGTLAQAHANGYTGTALVPDTLTDLGGGACFNDARVQVASFPTPSTQEQKRVGPDSGPTLHIDTPLGGFGFQNPPPRA